MLSVVAAAVYPEGNGSSLRCSGPSAAGWNTSRLALDHLALPSGLPWHWAREPIPNCAVRDSISHTSEFAGRHQWTNLSGF